MTSPRPRRRSGAARRLPAGEGVYRATRRPALPPGQLRALVEAHLHAHPDLDFAPAEIAHVLGRSRGAVINACTRLVELGAARRTRQTPQRYQAAAGQPPPTDPDERTGPNT